MPDAHRGLRGSSRSKKNPLARCTYERERVDAVGPDSTRDNQCQTQEKRCCGSEGRADDPLAYARSYTERVDACPNPRSANSKGSPRFRARSRLQIAAGKRQLESLDHAIEKEAPLLGGEAGFEHRDPV